MEEEREKNNEIFFAHVRNFLRCACDWEKENGVKERKEEDECGDGDNYFLHCMHKREEWERD